MGRTGSSGLQGEGEATGRKGSIGYQGPDGEEVSAEKHKWQTYYRFVLGLDYKC